MQTRPLISILEGDERSVSLWTKALHQNGLRTSEFHIQNLDAALVEVLAVVVVSASMDDEESLLTTLGYIRAHEVLPVLYAPAHEGPVDALISDLCMGFVVRNPSKIGNQAKELAKHLDTSSKQRFEFVTIAPGGDRVLAITGDGRAALAARPLNEHDDGSDIIEIRLENEDKRVFLSLSSGTELNLDAQHFTTHTRDGKTIDAGISGTHLGARVKDMRIAAGLTQAELARRSGIHRPNIARVEAGRHTPSIDTLCRIAQAIGVPAKDVLSMT